MLKFPLAAIFGAVAGVSLLLAAAFLWRAHESHGRYSIYDN